MKIYLHSEIIKLCKKILFFLMDLILHFRVSPYVYNVNNWLNDVWSNIPSLEPQFLIGQIIKSLRALIEWFIRDQNSAQHIK